MSRDAKVGLVIIFSFMILLGTVLMHRFHIASVTSNGSLTEPVVSESDPEGPVNERDNSFALGDSGVPPEAVDARTLSHSQDEAVQTHGAGVTESQKRLRTPNLARPPAKLPASQSNGALISLTEGTTFPQRAAVIDSPTSEPRQDRRPDGTRHADVANRADEASAPTQPLLEISNPRHELGRDNPDTSEPDTAELASQPDAVADSDDNEQYTEAEQDESMETADPTDPAAVSPSEQIVSNEGGREFQSPRRNQSEVGQFANVQQVGGNQRPGREPEKPPPLPRFGESPQATIEAVPPRNAALDHHSEPTQSPSNRSTPVHRTTPGKPEGAQDSSLTGQRTYVVKEGDSFWSISAKQYGTGKYFRALEEFNGHRLAVYEDGRRVLRPGTEIVLPDVAALRSKSTPAKQSDMSSAPSDRDGFRPRRSLGGSPYSDSRETRTALGTNSLDGRESSGSSTIYRVQEGDTLSTIAQRELGSSRRWQEIYELNREKLDNRLTIKVGMELKLPAALPVEKLADRPYGGR